MKSHIKLDQVFCIWLFVWALLSALFPSIIPYYPTKITSIIAFVSGIIISTSNKFNIFAKIVIFVYHSLILLGYYLLQRKYCICIDILLLVIYILYMTIRYKKTPYDIYLQFFFPPIKYKKDKFTLQDIISY